MESATGAASARLAAQPPGGAAQATGSGSACTWLLIGNSRWHWAEAGPSGVRFWHQDPAEAVASAPAPPMAWAAVGPLPEGLALPPERRLTLESVPLQRLPPWLGIDRALVGWQAWSEATGRAVLVADAGTVLSLTRLGADGTFAGGRLLAGLALQLRAMAAGTAALPALEPAGGGSCDSCGSAESPAWPHSTAEAMRQGTARGLAAAILAAALEAREELEGCRLVLTGGDGSLLLRLLQGPAAAAGIAVELRPDLALEALIQLRPAPA